MRIYAFEFIVAGKSLLTIRTFIFQTMIKFVISTIGENLNALHSELCKAAMHSGNAWCRRSLTAFEMTKFPFMAIQLLKSDFPVHCTDYELFIKKIMHSMPLFFMLTLLFIK